MDDIYDPNDFLSTDHINISEHFNEYRKFIDTLKVSPNNENSQEDELEEEIFRLMNVKFDIQKPEEYTKTCSVKKLDVPNEVTFVNVDELLLNKRIYTQTEIPEEAESLNTIKNLNKRLAVQVPVADNSDKYISNLKYRSELRVEEVRCGGELDLKEHKSVVLNIRIYLPFRHIYGSRINGGRFSQAISVHGSNTIAQFRDKILCSSDFGLSTDISEVPDVAANPLAIPSAKENYDSSFVYIEGVFYNDLRDEGKIDYSQVIRDWSKSRSIGPFQTAKMDEVRFNDLTIRLGYPNVFQHQGNCEHLFVFSDVRLLHARDSFYSEDYPMYISMSSKQSRMCMMCGRIVARVIVTASERLPADPTYFCSKCFKTYMYLDGVKIGKFNAYLVYDSATVL